MDHAVEDRKALTPHFGAMTPVRYDTIAANIAHVDVTNAQVHVRWKCPATGRDVGASTAAMAADASVTGRVQSSVKRSIASEVIYGAARVIAGLSGTTSSSGS